MQPRYLASVFPVIPNKAFSSPTLGSFGPGAALGRGVKGVEPNTTVRASKASLVHSLRSSQKASVNGTKSSKE